MEPSKNFEGIIHRKVQDSTAAWEEKPGSLKSKSNVILIVLDDVGFAVQ